MKDDLAKLQGTWNLIALETDGQKMPASSLSGARVVVEGSRFSSLGMGAVYEGDLDLDAKASPKTFNLRFTAGPEQGNTSLGIYELDGDNWKICLTVTGSTRPQRFATSAGSGLALETLRRRTAAEAMPSSGKAADEKAASTAELAGDPAPELAGEWVMAKCIFNGDPLPKQFLKMGKRVATGGELTVTMGPQTILKAKYAVNRSAQPMTMDYVLTHGSNSGKSQFGIYVFDGAQLTTCFRGPGEERPSDFNVVKGDGKTLVVWDRVRP